MYPYKAFRSNHNLRRMTYKCYGKVNHSAPSDRFRRPMFILYTISRLLSIAFSFFSNFFSIFLYIDIQKHNFLSISIPLSDSSHSRRFSVSKERYCFEDSMSNCPRTLAIVVTGTPETIIFVAILLLVE